MRPSTPSAGPVFRFGAYEVHVGASELRKSGIRIRIERKPWTLLLCLLQYPGECVTRDQLQAALWPDGTFVDFEHGVNVAVKKLRIALCDSAEAPRYIETVPGKGYRFIGSVTREDCVTDSTTAASGRGGNRHLPAAPAPSAPATLVDPRASRHSFLHRLARPVLILFVFALLVSGAALLRARRVAATYVPHATNVDLQRSLYVADWSGNGVLTYKIDPFTGSLKQISEAPSGEHPYFVAVVDGDFVYVANRGRADGDCGQGCTVSAYAIDQVSGTVAELDGSPYPLPTPPLALAVHPSGKFVYVTDVFNHLFVYERQENGGLRRIGDPLVVGARPFFLTVDRSGNFLYVANQDDATITAFSIGPGGALHPVPGSPFSTGLRPRSFLIQPDGSFAYVVNYGVGRYENREAACAGSYGSAHGRGCNISVFAIDRSTGSLAPVPGSPFELDGTNPHSAAMDPAGKFLFVANISSNNVSVFSINASTGAIRPVHGSPFPAGQSPTSLTLDAGGFLYVLNTEAHSISHYSVDFTTGRLISLGSTPVPGLGATSIAAQRVSRP